jgi:hypothetical protein
MLGTGAEWVGRELVAGALNYLMPDVRPIAKFKAECGFDPAEIARARDALFGEAWELESP